MLLKQYPTRLAYLWQLFEVRTTNKELAKHNPTWQVRTSRSRANWNNFESLTTERPGRFNSKFQSIYRERSGGNSTPRERVMKWISKFYHVWEMKDLDTSWGDLSAKFQLQHPFPILYLSSIPIDGWLQLGSVCNTHTLSSRQFSKFSLLGRMEIVAISTDGFAQRLQHSACSGALKRYCDEFPNGGRRHTESAHQDSPEVFVAPHRNPQPSNFSQKARTPSSYIAGTTVLESSR